MHFSSTIVATVLALASFSCAAPTPEPVPEITSDLVFEDATSPFEEPVALTTRNEALHVFEARGTNGCYSGSRLAAYGDVVACANYFKSLGTKACVVNSSGPTLMCQSGSARVYGQAVGKSSTSSYCGDVGNAVQANADQCRQAPYGDTGGYTYASGNGNLALGIGHITGTG